MSCSAKFPAEFSLSCIVTLVAQVRNGITPATVKDALWVAGCLIEKVGPATVPPLTGLPITLLNEADDLEALLAEIEAECSSLTRQADLVKATSASPPVGTQGWEVFIPLILELIKLIMENRKKKQQPAPTPEPSPAPVNSIGDNGSGVVRAPAPAPAPKKS
jgi:hypothetical protein